ncbi:multicopper oxidase domain-containing protein [Sinomonas sp. ASV322]|uniref:multicopper oxidase family protein n=1 Tax=Sinomonas sp. ASV322 TaxID=3041920 RepID=UPI0027DCFB7D|nr:multicopper oxidase domain-containing protein [Sinomonas sp. ASV322]MDQ4503459.1 multicopper oxidase domain-containing protein [Sinomonas sp. ASV322]
MLLSRRQFLRATAAATVLAPALASSLSSCAAPEDVPKVGFGTPLPVPPLAESRLDGDVRVFSLAAQAGKHEFVPGKPADSMGYNGSHLGPTLRAARGERVRIDIRNQLGDPTTLHFHGMRLPAADDGGPHLAIDPGASSSPAWTIDQPAATLWYHPHPHGSTEKQLSLGLVGMFFVDEPGAGVALPHTYGVDDFPLIVQDRRLDSNGQLTFDSSGNSLGTLGNSIAANGVLGASLKVTTARVRLRLLNASGGRWFNFGFADGRTFHVVASDGGLLAAPTPVTRVQLSPAERAEIVVSVTPGESIMLRSFSPDLGSVNPASSFGGGKDFDVLRLDAAASLTPSPALPAALAAIPALDVSGAHIRSFTLNGRNINNHTVDMNRVDEIVKKSSTEVWLVDNTNAYQHNFHVHGVQFQLLDVNGTPPPAHLRGWKDTIPLLPGDRSRIAMQMPAYADVKVPYMYHCHVVTHEDQGMMGQYLVTEDGTGPSALSMEGMHH